MKIIGTKTNSFCKRNVGESDFTSKLVIARLRSNSSLPHENEFFAVYLLVVIGFSNLSQKVTNMHVGLPNADEIGRKVGIPSSKTL